MHRKKLSLIGKSFFNKDKTEHPYALAAFFWRNSM